MYCQLAFFCSLETKEVRQRCKWLDDDVKSAVPPVIFGEIEQDVHLVVVLQQSIRRADVMTLQHRAVVVQDSRVRPAGIHVHSLHSFPTESALTELNRI